jgi:hypothetical protein
LVDVSLSIYLKNLMQITSWVLEVIRRYDVSKRNL